MPPRKRTLSPSRASRKRARVNFEDPVSLLSSIKSDLPRHPLPFTVGGKIDCRKKVRKNVETRNPVTIRWDSGPRGDRVRKISFPLNDTRTDRTRLRQLVHDCDPATFGRSRMDVQRFSSDYSLDENYVIEKITQTMAFPKANKNIYRGVRAELSELSISSAPSGKFKSNVSRHWNQFGLLVVCLPVLHKGGELTVRHNTIRSLEDRDRERIYDWGPSSSTHIQWAALYSGDEYEVSEVTEGHRITLTYNLFWVSFDPEPDQWGSISEDIESLPWAVKLKELFKHKVYLRKLGALGYTTTHCYPHTSSWSSRGYIEDQLRGQDMLVYKTLQHLCGSQATVRVTAVVDDTRYRRVTRNFHSDDPDDHDADYDGTVTGKFYVGNKLHKTITEKPIRADDDDSAPPSPGEFVSSHHEESSDEEEEPAYVRRKVTWLNDVPYEKATELAITATKVTRDRVKVHTYHSAAVIIVEFLEFKEKHHRILEWTEQVEPWTGSEQGEPLTGSEQGEPLTGSEQGEPLTGSEQGEPWTGSKQGRPWTGSEQGEPLTGSEQGEPLTGSEQGRPSTGSGLSI
ncbi:Endo-1,4-beta-xylanase C [Cytospora mali]|uniref:Endo-1,4-beta-xylanase C n=1 Tax=Cytospora mali TaxID=578113 RepID=A0A194VHS2_CYTMA|nr:Endo-1,4-beta-xylanase C [Valsa mali]